MTLADTLFLNKKNGAAEADEALLKAVLDFCEPYKTFLDESKTEREAVETAVRLQKRRAIVLLRLENNMLLGKRYIITIVEKG